MTRDSKTPARQRSPKKPPAPRHFAYAQGGLDSLCCVYATLNAVQVLRRQPLPEKPALDLFKYLASGLAPKFPGLLWEGASLRDVRLLLDRADDYARRRFGFRIERREPLLHHAPKGDDAYWRKLAELLTPPGSVLLVGLKQPWEHWTVVSRITARTLHFVDSLTIRIARRADVSLREGSTYRIDPHQVFVLQRVDP